MILLRFQVKGLLKPHFPYHQLPHHKSYQHPSTSRSTTPQFNLKSPNSKVIFHSSQKTAHLADLYIHQIHHFTPHQGLPSLTFFTPTGSPPYTSTTRGTTQPHFGFIDAYSGRLIPHTNTPTLTPRLPLPNASSSRTCGSTSPSSKT